MQAVTAMAHLRASVLYFLDISEQCGFTIDQQAALFHSIKPLFANKPVIVVCNKTDARAFSDLPSEQQQLIQDMGAEALRLSHGGVTVAGGAGENESPLMFMSTLKEDGIHAVRNAACDRLLAIREQVKVSSKRAAAAVNRLQVAMPKPRDNIERPPCIPASVLAERASNSAGMPLPKESRQTEKDMQEQNGGAGVYSADLRKGYLLEDDKWKYDIMPEIMDGHNVADFIDADIEAKLAELEREEEVLEVRYQFVLPLLCPFTIALPCSSYFFSKAVHAQNHHRIVLAMHSHLAFSSS